MVLLALICLLGYCLALSAFSGYRFNWTPTATICIASLYLYAAALFNVLQPAAYVLILGGWVALPVSLYWIIRHPKQAVRRCPLPAILLYVAWLALLWVKYSRLRDPLYFNWDEIAYYGYVIQGLCRDSHLLAEANSYPPGAALIPYLFSIFQPYSEHGTYFAHSVVVTAPLWALMPFRRWFQLPLSVLIVLAMFFIVHAFGFPYVSLYVDGMVAVYFAAAVLFGLLSPLRGLPFLLHFLPLLCFPALVKPQGFVLSELAIAIVYTERGLASFLRLRKERADICALMRDLWRRHIRFAVTLSILVAATYASWYALRPSSSISTSGPPYHNYTVLNRLPTHERWNVCSAALVKALYTVPVLTADGGHLNSYLRKYMGFPDKWALFELKVRLLPILGVLALLLFLAKPGKSIFQLRRLTLPVLMLCSLSAYLTFLLVTYVYVFPEIEGTCVAGLSRYLNTALVGFLAVTLGLLAASSLSRHTYSRYCGLLGILGLTSATVFAGNWTTWAYIHDDFPKPSAKRVSELQVAARVKSFVHAEERVYIVSQDASGSDYYGLRLALYPVFANRFVAGGSVDSWNLGKPCSQKQPSAWDIPCSAWSDLLRRNYAYVYIISGDDAFWKRYRSLFEDPKTAPRNHLFSVDKTNTTTVRLKSVRNDL